MTLTLHHYGHIGLPKPIKELQADNPGILRALFDDHCRDTCTTAI